MKVSDPMHRKKTVCKCHKEADSTAIGSLSTRASSVGHGLSGSRYLRRASRRDPSFWLRSLHQKQHSCQQTEGDKAVQWRGSRQGRFGKKISAGTRRGSSGSGSPPSRLPRPVTQRHQSAGAVTAYAQPSQLNSIPRCRVAHGDNTVRTARMNRP